MNITPHFRHLLNSACVLLTLVAAAAHAGEPSLLKDILWRQATPQARAAAAREALAGYKPGETIEVPAGEYDFGDQRNVELPDALQLTAPEGPRKTIWRCGTVYVSGGQGCAFELGDQCVIDGLTLDNTCKIDEQGVTVGYGKERKTTRSAEIRNAIIRGRAWAFYSWSNPAGSSVRLVDTDFYFARQGLSAGNSNGAIGQFITGERLRFFAEPDRTTYGGEVGGKPYSGVLAVTVRGGQVTLTDCQWFLRGNERTPRVVAVTNWYDDGSKSSLTRLVNPQFNLLAGPERERYDVDSRTGRVLITGGTGSGAKGELLQNAVAPGSISRPITVNP